MNFRNTYLVNTIRILFGLFMVFSGVSGLLMGPNAEGIPEDMILPTQVLWDTGIFQMIKVTEIVAGMMLVVGFLPWLAAILIAPIAVGIVIVNANMTPQFLFIGVLVCLLNGYLGYVYWDKYKQLFERRWKT